MNSSVIVVKVVAVVVTADATLEVHDSFPPRLPLLAPHSRHGDETLGFRDYFSGVGNGLRSFRPLPNTDLGGGEGDSYDTDENPWHTVET